MFRLPWSVWLPPLEGQVAPRTNPVPRQNRQFMPSRSRAQGQSGCVRQFTPEAFGGGPAATAPRSRLRNRSGTAGTEPLWGSQSTRSWWHYRQYLGIVEVQAGGALPMVPMMAYRDRQRGSTAAMGRARLWFAPKRTWTSTRSGGERICSPQRAHRTAANRFRSWRRRCCWSGLKEPLFWAYVSIQVISRSQSSRRSCT